MSGRGHRQSAIAARLRRVRDLLKQGVASDDIREETGVSYVEIANQRILLRAAGFAVASTNEARAAAIKKALACSHLDADALDVVDIFAMPHRPSTIRYWGVGDE